jgi:hypothetical protein
VTRPKNAKPAKNPTKNDLKNPSCRIAKRSRKYPRKIPGQKLNAGKLSAMNNPPTTPTAALPQNELEDLSQKAKDLTIV